MKLSKIETLWQKSKKIHRNKIPKMAHKKIINILVKYTSIKKRFDFLHQDKNVKK